MIEFGTDLRGFAPGSLIPKHLPKHRSPRISNTRYSTHSDMLLGGVQSFPAPSARISHQRSTFRITNGSAERMAFSERAEFSTGRLHMGMRRPVDCVHCIELACSLEIYSRVISLSHMRPAIVDSMRSFRSIQNNPIQTGPENRPLFSVRQVENCQVWMGKL